jgi:two-component system invasion response regulator UvrY
VKILILDDHPIVRTALRRLLEGSDRLAPVEICEAASGREALASFRRDRPDVVMMDLNLPGGFGGLELLRRLRTGDGVDGAVRVLVFSMHADTLHAARALQAGARGYISKNAAPDDIVTAVVRVAGGGRYIENEIAQELALQNIADRRHPLQQLTSRDLEILRLLGEGRSLAEIAAAIGIGYKTVANTCSEIKGKLGVARTADLIRIAVEMSTT